ERAIALGWFGGGQEGSPRLLGRTDRPVVPIAWTMASPASVAVQKCMDAECGVEFPVDRVLTACPACAGARRGESLLDVVYDLDAVRKTIGGHFAQFARARETEASG